MADIRATKNGNWSDATVWTPNPPAAGDVVRPNNFTVTIDVNVTVTEIRNDAGGGAVAGGSFTITTASNITSTNGFYAAVSVVDLMRYSLTDTITLNGNLSPLSLPGGWAVIVNNSTGTIIINGDVEQNGGQTQTVRNVSNGNVVINGNIITNAGTNGTVTNEASGTVTITGNITSNGGRAISNTSGTVTITGDLTIAGTGATNAISSSGGVINFIGNATAGLPGNGVTQNCFNISGGALNITGNLFARGTDGGSNTTISRVVYVSSLATVNITGTVYGPDYLRPGISTAQQILQNAFGVVNDSSGDIDIIGNCIGDISFFLSLGNTNPILRQIYNAVSNRSTGTIDITGNVLGGSTGVAVSNISTGTINITGDVIGGQLVAGAVNTSTGTIDITGAAEGGVSFAGVENDLVNGTILVQKIVFGANGQTATRGYIKFKNTPTIGADDVLLDDATTTNLVDINVVPNLQPSISDVRLGVTYSSGSLTGTMNVPPFNAVKAGVPVDNGVGTAALEPADVWNVLISGLTQSGSIGERLKNAATVETTGTQIASFNV